MRFLRPQSQRKIDFLSFQAFFYGKVGQTFCSHFNVGKFWEKHLPYVGQVDVPVGPNY